MTSPLVRIDRDALLEDERALSLEWLETDGLGGYASTTVAGCATRRYHGLLVARPPTSAQRYVFLSRFDETLSAGDDEARLSLAEVDGTLEPEGPPSLDAFELAPWPRSVHRVGEAEVVREVLLERGAPTVLVRYTVRGLDEPCELTLRPLLPCRNADDLTVENDVLDPTVEAVDGAWVCRPYATLPAVTLALSGEHTFEPDPRWTSGLSFRADEARGYEGREDQLSPGTFRVAFPKEGGEVVVAVTIGKAPTDPARRFARVAKRRTKAAQELGTEPRARVQLAADDFLYRAPNGSKQGRLGVLAGFPWFGEWGRDTFIALPGLTLARGRIDECAEVLSGAVELLRDGLLPNVYAATADEAHYGSVDASLWFARAVRLFETHGRVAERKGRHERVLDEYLPALVEIAEAYRDGTQLAIAADPTGLIDVGSPALNPTWMDAQTPDGPVTPREGQPVEIEALWYSLVAHVERLLAAKGDGKGSRAWRRLRQSARRSFLERFWLEEEAYLADRWCDGATDTAIRPNMVIAAALELSPLTQHKRTGVVERARVELLTRRGLRTLSPRDDDYVGEYKGGPNERDGAYHQGTVWPWLLGFYTEAYLRAHGNRREVVDHLRRKWDAFAAELDVAGLNHVSEVYDGDPPHRAGGTFAQAWNTAELLRSLDMLERGRP